MNQDGISAAGEPNKEGHRAFLNKYYGLSRGIYDLTRRYFLLGREHAIAHLSKDESWDSLVEIGPGTGRNLSKIRSARPTAAYGGVEASDAMLEFARRKAPFAKFVHGFAEDADIESVLGFAPDRILFAYCMTMVQSPLQALENCRKQVAKGGEVIVVDFGDMSTWPAPLRAGMSRYLATFHVYELPNRQLSELATAEEHGGGRYWSMYRFSSLR